MPKPKILVIEDDKFIQSAYVETLERKGFSVETMCDGCDSLSVIKFFAPDAILLDLMMPNRDGFEVLADLKENGVSQMIPVIVFSNMLEDDFKQKALDLGAREYLEKVDVSVEDVIRVIEKYVKRS